MNVAITQVSKEFIDDAIEKMMAGDKNLLYGLFWAVEDGRYVAMDATSNDLYVEDFESYIECALWLLKIIDREVNLTITKNSSKEWFEMFIERLSNDPIGDMWTDGSEILCKTEKIADDVADLIEHLYCLQDEEVWLCTGYYDPEEDAISGEVDNHTGWWYVDID